MGDFVRKILNFGCSSMDYNKDYICFAGDQIGLIDKSNGNLLFKISSVKNIISVCIDEKNIYAKKTNGTYYIIDIPTHCIIEKINLMGKYSEAQDFPIYLLRDGVIFDLLNLENGKLCAIKYDFYKKTQEILTIPIGSNYSCVNYVVENEKIYLLFKERYCKSRDIIECPYIVIDQKKMEITDRTCFSFESTNFPFGLVSKEFILLKNLQIVNIYALNRFGIRNEIGHEINKYGYFYKIIPIDKNSFILVFSKAVFVFDLQENKLIQKCSGKYLSSALCVDHKLYIGTWEEVFEVQL